MQNNSSRLITFRRPRILQQDITRPVNN